MLSIQSRILTDTVTYSVFYSKLNIILFESIILIEIDITLGQCLLNGYGFTPGTKFAEHLAHYLLVKSFFCGWWWVTKI